MMTIREAAMGLVAGQLGLSAEERLAVVARVGRVLSVDSPAR
jgi:hypothetical protein